MKNYEQYVDNRWIRWNVNYTSTKYTVKTKNITKVYGKKMTHFQSAPMKLDTHLPSSFSYRQNGAKMSWEALVQLDSIPTPSLFPGNISASLILGFLICDTRIKQFQRPQCIIKIILSQSFSSSKWHHHSPGGLGLIIRSPSWFFH